MGVEKTYHQKNFEGKLQGNASTVLKILEQNPNLNKDQKENMQTYFKQMGKAVEGYCTQYTPGSAEVLKAFTKANSEWELYCGGRADARQRILDNLKIIARAKYIKPIK